MPISSPCRSHAGDPGGTRAVSGHGGCPRAAEGTLNGRISHRLTSLTPHCPCAVGRPPQHGTGRCARPAGSSQDPGSSALTPPAPGTAVCSLPAEEEAIPAAVAFPIAVRCWGGSVPGSGWLESKLVLCLNADVWHRLVKGHRGGTGVLGVFPRLGQAAGWMGASPAVAALLALAVCVLLHALDTCLLSHRTSYKY